MPLSAEEQAWFESDSGVLLGVVSLDICDRDFVSTVLARDAHGRFRAVWLEINIASQEDAERILETALADLALRPASAFHQGDEAGQPLDMFEPIVPIAKRHHSFQQLTTQAGFSPALGLLRVLMNHFNDVDGNFVEQFQSGGFDARLWELYLYALLTELGYSLDRSHSAPDFHPVGLRGDFFVEAVTVNPTVPPPVIDETKEADYYAHYAPIKFGSALFSKLKKEYWKAGHVAGHPLAFAIQDFHAPRAMTWSNTALVEYLYGIRQNTVVGTSGSVVIVSERVDAYEWEGKRIPAGFFLQPETEHVSAVLTNPGGTLSKFNRMGYLAGFGERSLRMVRGGLCYRGDPVLDTFSAEVHASSYAESWSEGLAVYHNPRAKVPLPEMSLPGAAHHTLKGGQIVASMPPFFPVGEQTFVLVQSDDEQERADT